MIPPRLVTQTLNIPAFGVSTDVRQVISQHILDREVTLWTDSGGVVSLAKSRELVLAGATVMALTSGALYTFLVPKGQDVWARANAGSNLYMFLADLLENGSTSER